MRPHYHFTSSANWLSDPNGLVHDGTQWHLFFQYNPLGEDWGEMSWGHATSPDLAHWCEQRPALLANDQTMIFSGSAVVDHANSAGFGTDAMVAIYTAAARGLAPNQSQAIAWSTDKGATWTHHPANPVLDLAMADFRDPFVFWHPSSDSWIMVVVKSNEQIAQIYRSGDLVNWNLASEIAAGTAPGRVWECPTLVELPIIGSDRSRWLFKVDALHDAPGAGALCLTGDFDGVRFTADGGWQVVDAGRDFYAAVAWNGPRDSLGRPAWIGWMGNHAYQHQFPKKGWRGAMSLPRRLGLSERGDGLRLAQEVEPSVRARFDDATPVPSTGRIAVASRIAIDAGFAGRVEIADGAGSVFTLAAEDTHWSLARDDAANPFLAFQSALKREEGAGLEIWIDSETIEILSTCGTGCASFQHRPGAEMLRIETEEARHLSLAALR